MIPPSGLVKEPIPRLAFLQRRVGLWAKRLKLFAHFFAPQDHLTHVRLTSNTAALSRHCLCSPIIPIRVLYRHLPPGKVDHLTAQFNMQRSYNGVRFRSSVIFLDLSIAVCKGCRDMCARFNEQPLTWHQGSRDCYCESTGLNLWSFSGTNSRCHRIRCGPLTVQQFCIV